MTNPSQKELIDHLHQLAAGFARTQELYTTVKLGIPDQLANGPKQTSELAAALKIDPINLFRFLRVLVARGILAQGLDGRFSLTPISEPLRSDHPESLANQILIFGEVQYQVGQGMLYSVETGKPAFDHVFGKTFWEYLSEHPDVNELFNTQWGKTANTYTERVIETYDFSSAATLVDVGGGNGTLIGAILKNHPALKGLLFDGAKAISEAQLNFRQSGLFDRCQTITGSFLKDTIPAGKDLYILSRIIHDWDDEQSGIILGNCRMAMGKQSKLLIIEQIMPDQVVPGSAVAGSDMSMLLLFGGAERTLPEFRSIINQAGLQISNVIPFKPVSHLGAGQKTDWAIIECGLRE